jgi:hypothetical protein
VPGVPPPLQTRTCRKPLVRCQPHVCMCELGGGSAGHVRQRKRGNRDRPSTRAWGASGGVAKHLLTTPWLQVCWASHTHLQAPITHVMHRDQLRVVSLHAPESLLGEGVCDRWSRLAMIRTETGCLVAHNYQCSGQSHEREGTRQRKYVPDERGARGSWP